MRPRHRWVLHVGVTVAAVALVALVAVDHSCKRRGPCTRAHHRRRVVHFASWTQGAGSGSAVVRLACLAQSYFFRFVDVLQIRFANRLISLVAPQSETDAAVLADSRYGGSGSQ